MAKIGDAQARAILSDFVKEFRSEPIPVRPGREDCLLDYLNNRHAELRDVRESLAQARVDLVESARLGSSVTAEQRRALELDINRLSLRRIEIISQAAFSEEFNDFFARSKSDYTSGMAAWEKGHLLALSCEEILSRRTLPTVEVDSLDPSCVVTALEESAREAPEAGRYLFREPEPFSHLKPFQKRSVRSRGLPQEVFGMSVNLLIGPEAQPAREHALAAGAVVLRGKVAMPLGPDRFPLRSCDWDALDPFLPVAARRLVKPFLPDLIPQTSWGASLANLLTPGSWRELREAALYRSNHACMLCGSTTRLEAHEVFEFLEPLSPDNYGIQRLVDIRALCSSCHSVHHIGRETAQGRGIQASARLGALNRWSRDETAAVVRMIFERHARRSEFTWALDLSYVRQTTLVVKDKWHVDDDGWISDEAGMATRIFGALWRQPRGIEIFDPVPPIHELGWDEPFSLLEPDEDEDEDEGDADLSQPLPDLSAHPAVAAEALASAPEGGMRTFTFTRRESPPPSSDHEELPIDGVDQDGEVSGEEGAGTGHSLPLYP